MFDFTVRPDHGEPYEATATSRDVVVWEKGGRGRAFGQLADNPRMVDMYGLAFVTCRRLGLFSGNATDFETQVDLEFEDDKDDDEDEGGAAHRAGDPTYPAR